MVHTEEDGDELWTLISVTASMVQFLSVMILNGFHKPLVKWLNDTSGFRWKES